MPALSNQKHELFAQNLAQGMSNAAAYQAAGYSCKNNEAASANANRLLKNDKVRSRREELCAEVARKAEVTQEWLVEQGKEILIAARADNSHAAAVSALKEIGVLSGKRVEKRDDTLSGPNGGPVQVTRIELVAPSDNATD